MAIEGPKSGTSAQTVNRPATVDKADQTSASDRARKAGAEKAQTSQQPAPVDSVGDAESNDQIKKEAREYVQARAAERSAAATAQATADVWPKEHTVAPFDSLWKIAEKYYGKENGKQWPRIYEANRDQIENPRLIHPGQKFTIPPLDQDAPAAPAAPAAEKPAAEPATPAPQTPTPAPPQTSQTAPAAPTAAVAPASTTAPTDPPRIVDQYGQERDMEWVAQTYGSDFERATMTAPDGSVYRLVEMRERTGPSNIDVYVQDAAGNPLPGVPVTCTNRYNNEQLPTVVTGADGRAGYAMGGGSYILPSTVGSGAFNIGVGDGDIPSDQGLRLGMLGGTNHTHLDLVFELVQEAPQDSTSQPQKPAPAAPAAPTTPAAPASSDTPVGDIVESVYQSELGRPSDPGGKAHWSTYAQNMRDQGKTDEQIRGWLVDEFHKTPEYQAKHPGETPPASTAKPAAPAPATTAPTTTAPASGTGQFLKPDGSVHNFIGGNYTDLGRLDNGTMPDPTTPEGAAAMRAAVAADLDRLQGEQVDEVRIWAGNVPGGESVGGLENPEAMAARVKIIAEEAARRDMTVTVDLFDGNCVGGKDVNNYRAMDDTYNKVIDTVVGKNRDADNIQWSLGNEIGDYNNPEAFANWYVEKANLIRQAGGPGTKVVTEFTPGSAINHPRGIGYDRWAACASKIINASDIVGIHFYPKHGPDSMDAGDQLEYETLCAWNDLAQKAGKPFVVGEFNVSSEQGGRSEQSIQQWLQRFEEMGVDHVSLWQFLKNEGGHIDEESFDSLRNRSYLDLLHRNGWLGRKPRNNGI
ncbi:MAG: cellulase family glycosylhydrolase [Deltaproteobacteria bacterium]|nr:cellulase family glycosylhydrolase [Deltaproteobacteria bacterium]